MKLNEAQPRRKHVVGIEERSKSFLDSYFHSYQGGIMIFIRTFVARIITVITFLRVLFQNMFEDWTCNSKALCLDKTDDGCKFHENLTMKISCKIAYFSLTVLKFHHREYYCIPCIPCIPISKKNPVKKCIKFQISSLTALIFIILDVISWFNQLEW